MMRVLIISFLVLIALSGCKKGALLDNQVPDTKIYLDTIALEGPDRLNSVVTLHWSGTDVDGFIKGYDLSFDGLTWFFTTRTDSTFIFSISSGSDTADIPFYVRAVDNLGMSDPQPAYLNIPIRNTPPTIAFDQSKLAGDTVYSVGSFIWNAEDIDGIETLDSVFIRINNGNWYGLPAEVSFLTLVPENPSQIGATQAKVYRDEAGILQSAKADGLVVGGMNKVYVKVKDQGNAFSPEDSTPAFYVRPKTSDLLVIDAYKNSVSATQNPDLIYLDAIAGGYGTFDYMPVDSASNLNVPVIITPTLFLMYSLYDKVVFYGDNVIYKNQLLIEALSSVFKKYLDQGGKLLCIQSFPRAYPELPSNASSNSYYFTLQSPVFEFSPMDSVSTYSTNNAQARIPIDSLLVPDPSNASAFPILKCSSTVTGADPFYAKANAEVLYNAQILRVNNWVGPNIAGARIRNLSGQTNQVFFSVELQNINGISGSLQQLFTTILSNEFNW